MERTEAEEAYFLMLVANGGECPHPPQYRHEIGAFRDAPFEAKQLDPFEWECAICGMVQVRKRT